MAWDAPRQRPTAYALAALFMLLLSNLFPFVNMNVAGVTSEITLLEIPGVLFSEDYASLGTFFLLFVQLVPAFCLITILLLVNRAELPVRLKEQLARVLFQLKTWGMAEIFLAGVLVSFVKLMAYGSIGVGSSFLPWCLFCVLQLRAFQCVDRRWLWDDIAPVRDILATFAANICCFDGAGKGQAAKLANQVSLGACMVGMADAMAFAELSGLDLEKTRQMILGGTGKSGAMESLAPKALDGDYKPGFMVEHFIKDLRLALAYADDRELALPGADVAFTLYDMLEAIGGAKLGTQAVTVLYKEEADAIAAGLDWSQYRPEEHGAHEDGCGCGEHGDDHECGCGHHHGEDHECCGGHGHDDGHECCCGHHHEE